MDFVPILKALHDIDYDGGIHVELSRHSHEGPRWALESYRFLSQVTS
jgi:sugar phosphate isomerase/epimerase